MLACSNLFWRWPLNLLCVWLFLRWLLRLDLRNRSLLRRLTGWFCLLLCRPWLDLRHWGLQFLLTRQFCMLLRRLQLWYRLRVWLRGYLRCGPGCSITGGFRFLLGRRWWCEHDLILPANTAHRARGEIADISILARLSSYTYM